MSNEKMLKPNHTNVIIVAMPNPYLKEKLESGIIIPGNVYKSNETGDYEHDLEQVIKFGKVVSTGPNCVYIKEGDEVFFDDRSCRPIPFLRKGYLLTNEQNILCKTIENATDI